MTLSRVGLSIITSSTMVPRITTLSRTALVRTLYNGHDECHYDKCRYAERRSARKSCLGKVANFKLGHFALRTKKFCITGQCLLDKTTFFFLLAH